MPCQMRARRRAAISSRWRRSLNGTPSTPAISFSLAFSLPSASGRRSAAIGSAGWSVRRPAASTSKRNAGGKHSSLRRCGVRLAVDDQRQDAISPAQPLELDDFLVDPAAAAPPPGCTARSGGSTEPAPRAAPRADRPTRRARRGRGTPGRSLLGSDRSAPCGRPAAWARDSLRCALCSHLAQRFVAMAVADEYRILAPGGNDTRRVHARLRPGRSSLAKIVTTTVVRQEDKRFAKEVSRPFSSRGDEALQKKLRENRPSSSTPPGSRCREALGYPAAICSAITGQ